MDDEQLQGLDEGVKQSYLNIQSQISNLNSSLYDFGNTPWYRSKKKVKNQLSDFNTQLLSLNNDITQYNNNVKTLGLEGVAPKVEEYSAQTMGKIMQSASDQVAQGRAASMSTTANTAALAFDVGKNVFNDNRSTYDGKYGDLASGIDAAGDGFANAALASGNPYAMMAGAAYKGMSMLNQVIGKSTDGMTKTDAILDSNLGFVLAPGIGKLNAALGSTTDKFEIDNEIRASLGNSYNDTYDELEDAESVAGKRYGLFSKNARNRAQNNIKMAEQRQSMLSNISQTAQDRSAAGYYEGTSFRNAMNLRGGYQATHAARKGMKLNLDFAHKVTKAQRGLSLNAYKPVTPPQSNDRFIQGSLPAITPEYAKSAYASMDPVNLEASGIHFDRYDGDKIVFRVDSQELYDKLEGDPLWKKQIMELYHVTGIELVGPEIPAQTVQGESEAPSTGDTQEGDQIEVGEEYGSAEDGEEVEEEEEGQQETPPIQVPDLEWSIGFNGFTEEEQEEFYRCVDQLIKGEATETTSKMHLLASDLLNYMSANAGSSSIEDSFVAFYDTPESGKSIEYIKRTKGNSGDVTVEGSPSITTNDQIMAKKKGGTFTFMPYTDEQVNKFKAGGSFNVIPDGALHKNKHHMEGAEGLTKKGIPVVTEEDGKKVQQAEIEVNEIIFRLEVTEKLEKLAKEGTDEAALEAGKLITEEILRNTHDNTGLIKETV